jgi:hypothetical protein
MKKVFFIVVLFLLSISSISADDLADILQDLAIQTACLGMYSTAQTGVYVTSRYDDPPDWYDPPIMANRFARMSGNMTRIETFYGVCFDYAQFAWNDIKKYQELYNDAGMKGQQWYIAVANVGDPNTIILYDPLPEGRRNEATIISNGVYLKENSRHRVYAHDGATGHAWLWVQHKNGTWYWIDPTWTDNTGFPWWGMVQNGKEVQYYPDPEYCVASNYPQPPRPNETPAERETRSSNSTYISSANNSYYDFNQHEWPYFSVGYNYAYGLPGGFTIAVSPFIDGLLLYTSWNFGKNNMSNNMFEWIFGGYIPIINRLLMIPIGIGGNHSHIAYGYHEGFWAILFDIEGEPKKIWENAFVMEIGLQLIIFNNFYISSTYRLIGFNKSSFTIGAGFVF